jgi:hypothetical protein
VLARRCPPSTATIREDGERQYPLGGHEAREARHGGAAHVSASPGRAGTSRLRFTREPRIGTSSAIFRRSSQAVPRAEQRGDVAELLARVPEPVATRVSMARRAIREKRRAASTA